MLKGRPRVRGELRRRFWREIAQGASTAVASVVVGVAEGTGGRWFAEAGGMPPITLAEPSGRYLSFVEREEIAVLLAQRLPIREIARRIGRPASTISRELGRNIPRNSAARGGRIRLDRYRASSAQATAEARARRPKPATPGRLRDWCAIRAGESRQDTVPLGATGGAGATSLRSQSSRSTSNGDVVAYRPAPTHGNADSSEVRGERSETDLIQRSGRLMAS